MSAGAATDGEKAGCIGLMTVLGMMPGAELGWLPNAGVMDGPWPGAKGLMGEPGLSCAGMGTGAGAAGCKASSSRLSVFPLAPGLV